LSIVVSPITPDDFGRRIRAAASFGDRAILLDRGAARALDLVSGEA
jgi:hypothetical protein